MPISSAVVIARLLGAEGFTDHLANQIEKYWRNRSGLTARQERQIAKLDNAIAEIANKLDVRERLALGRFIGLHKKMSFDSGLRIGITAFAVKVEHGNQETEANQSATSAARASEAKKSSRRSFTHTASAQRREDSSSSLTSTVGDGGQTDPNGSVSRDGL